MTDEELDALPEWERFSMKDLPSSDGMRRVIPVCNDSECSYLSDDDPLYAVDARGQAWLFKKIKGILHKVKTRAW